MSRGRILSNDAEDRGGPLNELRRLRSEAQEVSRRQAATVRQARVEGYSWQAIASALEISKQAAHKRYGRS